MAKKGTLGYEANNVRKMAERRITRINRALKNADISQRMKTWLDTRKKNIESAIRGTYQRNSAGKVRSVAYRKGQVTRARNELEKIPKLFRIEGNADAITEHQLNLASVKSKASIYTYNETKLFYRITQKIWQKSNVGEHERNTAILEWYNSAREQNDLSPLTLDEIVDYVLKKNEMYQKVIDTKPEDMTEEQLEFYNRVMNVDSSDAQAGSPPGITEAIVNAIRDALENLFILPDPLEIKKD